MNLTPTDISAALGAELLDVVARLNRLANQRVRLPVPAAQARLLATIESLGVARISELAAVDHCSQPTMTTQVRRLEEAGLTTRTADSSDARAVLIRITQAGLQTLARVRHDRAAAIEPLLARLAPADRRVLTDAVQVLQHFLADFQPMMRSPAPADDLRTDTESLPPR